jgi:hypothetical protein
VVLGHYAGLDGGSLEIDAIKIPAHPSYSDKGSIRGRLKTRAVGDQLNVLPGSVITPDTIELSIEFWVELDGWADGRATIEFMDGALAGESAVNMIGSGSIYYVGNERVDPQFVVSLTGPLTESGDRLQLWFASRLRGPGEATLEAIDPELTGWPPRNWPDHFVGGYIEDSRIASVSGSLRLDAYEEYGSHGDMRWGEAKGQVRVDLVIKDRSAGIEPTRTTAEITFHVPMMFFFQFVDGPNPSRIGRIPEGVRLELPGGARLGRDVIIGRLRPERYTPASCCAGS